MDNFAHDEQNLVKIRLGKLTLGYFTNGNQTLGKLTRVY